MEEAKARTTPQEFLNWISFWEYNPPIRKYLNLCQANICYTISATTQRARGSKAPAFDKFLFDHDRAKMSQDEKVVADIQRIFGK